MHETTGLHNFYAFLCSKFSTVSANSVPLAAHMSVFSVNYLFFQVHGILALAAQLTEEVQYYRSQLFATSTKATYKTHRNTYFRFCNHMG